MVGMSHRLEVQKAHSMRFLSYGHLGTTTYDEEEKTWKTLRIIEPRLDSHGLILPGGERRSAFPLHLLTSRVVGEAPHGLQATDETDSQEIDLCGNHDFVSDPTRKSGTNDKERKILQSCDNPQQKVPLMLAGNQSPNLSALLAFGNAVLTSSRSDGSEAELVPIAACISGGNGESVRMVRIGEEVTANSALGAESSSLYVPFISGQDEAFWTGPGTPVQQICFAAELEYQSTWMAARLQSATTIFHPTFHRKPVPPRYERPRLPSENSSSSALDTNPIITIPISRTGGHAHAHVSFHPKDCSRFALIDEHGNWSVWLLDGEDRDSLCACFWATLLCSGKIWTWEHEKRFKDSPPYHDGWHRISWFTTSDMPSDMLFVCNRRIAAVYKASGEYLGSIDLRLGHARENQSILDVQWSRVVSGRCFVLTSTRLFWLCYSDNELKGSTRGHGILQVLLSWQHFKQRGDVTLRLVLLETGLTTFLLLVSRLVDLVLVFRADLFDGTRHSSASLSDPLSICLPDHPNHKLTCYGPGTLIFRAVQCRQEGATVRKTREPVLCKLFSLYEDLSIVEYLYSSTELGLGLTADEALSSTLRASHHTSLRHAKPGRRGLRGLESFIVPDKWFERVDTAIGRDYRGDDEQREVEKADIRTVSNVDWRDVYAHLTDETEKRAFTSRSSIDPILKEFLHRSIQARPPGIPLMSDLMSGRLRIVDIDEDSAKFDIFSSELKLRLTDNIEVKALPIFLSQSQSTSRLSWIYDIVVSVHLTPLSYQLPDRARLNKERLARRVSADLIYGSTAIYPIPTTSTNLSDVEAVPGLATSQPAPYSSPAPPLATRPESVLLPTLAAATTASAATDENPILTRLRKYMNISPPSPVIVTSSSPTLSSILRHLPTSADINPSGYSYRAMERTLAAEHEEEIAIAAGAADPRARKKAEKARLARAKREQARRRAAAEIASSQRLPPKILSSQAVGGYDLSIPVETGEDMREVQSSQVRSGPSWGIGTTAGSSQPQGPGNGCGQDIPMTQPERGLFGTRTGTAGAGFVQGQGQRQGQRTEREKGKKRAAGF